MDNKTEINIKEIQKYLKTKTKRLIYLVIIYCDIDSYQL